MYVSKNSFIIPDVYKDLLSCIESHNLEKACSWSVELIISGEIKHLLQWLIQLASHHNVTTNILFYDFLSKKIQLIKEQKYNWKKSKIVKESLAELVVCVSKNFQSQKMCFFKQENLGIQQEFIDALLIHKCPREFREVKEVFTFFVGNAIFTLICHIYDMLLRGNTKDAFRVAYFLIQKGTVKECETLSIVNVTEGIAKYKNDSIWILWQLLFVLTQRPEMQESSKTLVSRMFEIFCFDYNKKERLERANLLFTAMLICSKRKSLQFHNVYDDIVISAGKQIHLLYDDFLDKTDVKPKKDTLKADIEGLGKEIKTTKTTSNSKKKSSMTPEQVQNLEEKMKYFFVLTYKKSPTHLYVNPKTFDNTLPQYQKTIDVESWTEIEPSNSQYCNVEKTV